MHTGIYNKRKAIAFNSLKDILGEQGGRGRVADLFLLEAAVAALQKSQKSDEKEEKVDWQKFIAAVESIDGIGPATIKRIKEGLN